MEKLSPERVLEVLKRRGVEVTLDQAASILKFLQMLADITVAQHLRNGKR